jgi:hypothetical protein
MAVKITPDILRHAFEFLAATEPFCRWSLPDADDVDFRVGRSQTVFGWMDWATGKRPVICLSQPLHYHTNSIMETMAHEMIHLYLRDVKADKGAPHGAPFRKLAAQVCRVHGWDLGSF